MFGLEPLVPAYGRDYKSKKEVEAAFLANKDFQTPMGQYTNCADIQRLHPDKTDIQIRYAKKTKVTVVKIPTYPVKPYPTA